jgi:hypothetical protein
MDRLRTPAEAQAFNENLVSKGKRPNSFENAFPRIHHFKGGSGSLQAHIKFIGSPDADKTYSRQTNENVVLRLELIKSYVVEFLENNPGWNEINEFKYQTFAEMSVEKVPFKKPAKK